VALLLRVTEFGTVLSPEVVANESVMPSVRVEPEKLSHLDDGQRAELVEVLDEFAACFSDKPGLCDVVTIRWYRDDARLRTQADETIPRAHRVPSRRQSADTRTVGYGTYTPVCQSDGELHRLRRQGIRWCAHCL